MTPVHQRYTSEIHHALNHYAAWDPGTPLTLGTVGTFIGRHFVPQDHLDNLKINYKVRKDDTPSRFEYHTVGGVDIKVKAKGASPKPFAFLAQADAGLKLTFNKSDAIWFAAQDCLSHRIDDQINVGRQIAKLYTQKKWGKRFVFISHLVTARRLTVLTAAGSGASVELKLKGNVLAKSLDLAKISTSASVAGANAMTTRIVGARGTTPLFRVSGVQQDWLDWLMGRPVTVGVYYGPRGASTEVHSSNEPPVLEVVP